MKSISKPIIPVMNTKRLEALTDGVFSIAMTLLVLNLKLPIRPNNLSSSVFPELVLELWPDIINYALSFILLSIFWIVHHSQFHHIEFVDNKILWINIMGLMFIALVPFSTSLIAEFGDMQLAAIIFEGNLLGIGIMFYLNWHYATGKHHLIDSDLTAQEILLNKKKYLVIPFVSLVAIGLSFLNPNWSELVYFAIPFILIRYQHHPGTLVKK